MSGILDALSPTTIANYARGAWDGVSLNAWFFKEMKSKGVFQYDTGGDTLSGPVEAGRYLPQTSAPGMDISSMFVPKVRHARWNFAWAEKINALTIDRGLLRRNSGDQALVRLRDTEIPALFRDLLIAQSGLLSDILTQDGGAYTGSGLPVYGFPSFLRNVSDVANLNGLNPSLLGGNSIGTALTGAAAAVTDKEVCCVSQTYGGLSLAPNGLTAVDGLQYDAWSPVMVNTGYNWGGGANAEAANIELWCQHLINRMSRFGDNDPSQMPNLGLMDRVHYTYLGDKKSSRETVFVQATQTQPNVPDTGYQPVKGLYHAGVFWRWDALMAASSTIAGNSSKMKFYVQPLYKDQDNSSPLKVAGEEAGIMETAINFIPERRGYAVSATIPGQVVFEPRYWGCARAYKTA